MVNLQRTHEGKHGFAYTGVQSVTGITKQGLTLQEAQQGAFGG